MIDRIASLAADGGNVSAIARIVGVHRSTVRERLARLGISLPDGRANPGRKIAKNKPRPRIVKRGGKRSSEFWAEHDDELIRLVGAGLRAVDVAQALGVSKNAVLGRSNRLGLRWARSPQPKPVAEPKRAWDFPPPGRCVFPHGHPNEPDFGFCGERVAVIGAPYCHDHMAATHQRAPQAEPEAMAAE